MRLVIAITLYAAVGVFTFGHSAANSTISARHSDVIAIGAFIGGVGWPFYWAWELQE